MPNTKVEEYRRRAEDCRSRAISSDTVDVQAFWADLATRWDQSADKVEELARSGTVVTEHEREAA